MLIVGGTYSHFEYKLIQAAFDNIWRCDKGKSRHVSILTYKRSKILSVGWNSENKTHPLALKFGYYGCAIHSELSAITKFPRHHFKFEDAILWNVRINRFNEVALSKPCQRCQNLIVAFGIKSVYYSDESGKFAEL